MRGCEGVRMVVLSSMSLTWSLASLFMMAAMFLTRDNTTACAWAWRREERGERREKGEREREGSAVMMVCVISMCMHK